MKNILYVVLAALLAAALVGCNSCGSNRRSWFSGWWNRGDSCRTCTSGDVIEGPGMLGTPILNNVPAAPRSTVIENLPMPVQ